MTHQNDARYHGLDALRAGAMLLGLVLHSTLPYTVPETKWFLPPGVDVPPVPQLWELVIVWIHQWRMPVFFILAGFFAALVLTRKGPRLFAQDRALRIGGTFVVFMAAFTFLGLKQPQEMHHLWFLWVLLILYLLTLILRGIGFGPLVSRLLWVLDRPSRLLWLYGPLLVLVVLTKSETMLWHRIPLTLTDIELRGLVYYGSFFLLGFGLWQRPGLLHSLAKPKVWVSLLGVSCVFCLGFAMLEALNPKGFHKIALAMTIAGVQFCLIFGIIGLAQAIFTRSGPILRFLVDSAYAVYLFHIYPLIGIGAILIGEGMAPTSAIPLSIAMTAVVSLALYCIAVRYTPLDWLLSGYRKARFKLRFGRRATD